MGSYNKEYEKYYRKINKTRKTSPNHEVNFKTKGSYKRREKDSDNIYNLCFEWKSYGSS